MGEEEGAALQLFEGRMSTASTLPDVLVSTATQRFLSSLWSRRASAAPHGLLSRYLKRQEKMARSFLVDPRWVKQGFCAPKRQISMLQRYSFTLVYPLNFAGLARSLREADWVLHCVLPASSLRIGRRHRLNNIMERDHGNQLHHGHLVLFGSVCLLLHFSQPIAKVNVSIYCFST